MSTHPDETPLRLAARANGAAAADVRLVVPDGWVIAPAAVARLHRQLAAADASVVGVCSVASPVPAGSSYRVHAERVAMRSGSAGDVRATPSVATPTLVRVAATVDD